MTAFDIRNLKEWRPRSVLKKPSEVIDSYHLKTTDLKFVADAILQSLKLVSLDLCAFRHHFVKSSSPQSRKPTLCSSIVAAKNMNCAHMHDKPVISHALAFIVQNELADLPSCNLLLEFERNSYDALRASDYYATIIGGISAGNDRGKPYPTAVLSKFAEAHRFSKQDLMMNSEEAFNDTLAIHEEVAKERKVIIDCLLESFELLRNGDCDVSVVINRHLGATVNLYALR